jgi:RNA polymerase sigma-70 factor, ECF subfamily
MTQGEIFLHHRSLLFSIAYRMIGSLDAEDIVQDVFLQFQKMDLATIANPRALLVTIVTRRCLDYLKSARHQREQYIGSWLPEPLITTDMLESIEQKETLEVGFLLLLESLLPIERAVFLLRDVFDFDYAEIADIIEKSPQNCRQLAHRARSHVSQKKARYQMSAAEKERLLQEFLAACYGQDINSLVGILAEDCKLYSDGGGKVAAALKPVCGRDRTIAFIFNVLKQVPSDVRLVFTELNGEPGSIVMQGDRIEYSLIIHAEEGKIVGLYTVRNPDKLIKIKPLDFAKPDAPLGAKDL